ncbi:protein CASC3-like isoform X2 [Rhinoderma darwinii]|uniref:protein CASC3-like isoform X2 n=1 Tax=Rhinoderma darwinii TaxID=43563 RepID=UPI003F6802AF
MLSKWLTARPKNIQPAAPRRHVASYYESSEESEADCYACYTNDDSTKVIIKSEYDSIGAPSTEEENSETVHGAVIGERQSGDGQESLEPDMKKATKKSRKQVDDDQDLKNPAYIPQQGDFFEHDLRRTNDGALRRKNRRTKKHVQVEGRWKHDRFYEDEQAPKSREELIATYGYDIRTGKNPYKIHPCQPTKQSYRSHPKVKNKSKRRRPLKSLQSSSLVAPNSAYKELRDLHNRQSPCNNPYSDPGRYKR